MPGELVAVDLTLLQWARLRSMGITVKESRMLGHLGMTVTRLQMPFDASETHVLEMLRSTMPKLDLELNHHYRPTEERCKGERCFGHSAIQWPQPGQQQCLIATRIGMLDTAVDAERARVQAVVKRFGDRAEPSTTEHGSAVAALLAGQHSEGALGLLPASTVYAADVFDVDEDGKVLANAANLAAALDWLRGEKVQAVNISLAGPDNRVLAKSVDALVAAELPIVASAGNDGPQAKPAYPAAYAGVIAVTAVDARKRLYTRANRGEHIGFAAPGVRVWTPVADDAEYRTGTSFATPFVTAIVASLRHNELVSFADLEKALAERAEDLGEPGHDPLYGWGLVQGAGACEPNAVATGGTQ